MKLTLPALILMTAALVASAQAGAPEGASGQLPAPPAVGTSSKSPLNKPSALTVGQELELRRELETAKDREAQAVLDAQSLQIQLRGKDAAINELVALLGQQLGQGVVTEARGRWDALERVAVKALGGDYDKADRVKKDDKGVWAKPTELVKAPEKKG